MTRKKAIPNTALLPELHSKTSLKIGSALFAESEKRYSKKLKNRFSDLMQIDIY